MSYDEFVTKIREILNEKIGGRLKISVCTAIKNNNCERKGIAFSERGKNISPTIYLEEYYEKFLEGQEIEKIAAEVAGLYDQVKLDHSWEGAFLCDFENVKDRIIFKLINREKNKKLLSRIPYVSYMDFAVVFSVLVDVEPKCGQIAMMQIKKEHLAMWNVSEEEVCRCAISNTPVLLPYEFRSMFAVIADMMGEQEEIASYEETDELYILSNRLRNCGANTMFYPGMLERIGERLKQNYYILPSSIHEVIIVPEQEALSVEEMRKIVREVNDTYVHKEEYLSDGVYYYDRREKIIRG